MSDDGIRLVRADADLPRLVWELRTREAVVGYLEALDGDSVWVCHIGVDPQYRGRGYATRLLQAVLAFRADAPIGLAAAPFPSWREPGLTHDGLRAWYVRHGFHPEPRREDPYRMIRLPASC
ncbi:MULTISPECIES: GNAT family N-acetyltransferase [unclassified Streptomyces]|uniref:GNAT family N-acetyltransferase n=1 Tax=unclassified Streptomyces TaxID=2593676 RepID=UPI0015E857BF|nr:GNAT family N-acetyltransferase [Streptomyces sp. F12]